MEFHRLEKLPKPEIWVGVAPVDRTLRVWRRTVSSFRGCVTTSFAPSGLNQFPPITHGFRRGL
jgi:hypothetical protein